MVTCGLIVGFDSDNEEIFEMHRQFTEAAHIPQAMVNVLFAIPRTPLYERLLREGRLDSDGARDDWGSGTFISNVIPLRMDRKVLLKRYVMLMQELYEPEAFFGRIDALCLLGKWLPSSGATAFLKNHPLRRLRRSMRAAVEASYVFAQLMVQVPDAALRRFYRRRLFSVLCRRPHPRLLRMYAVYCAIHWHYDRLIGLMATNHAWMHGSRERAGTLLPSMQQPAAAGEAELRGAAD